MGIFMSFSNFIINNKKELFVSICLLLFFVIFFLKGYGNLSAYVIFFILALYLIYKYCKNLEKPPMPDEPNEEMLKKIERAWKYDNAADKRIQQRLNYFMVAESMLLFSYVTSISLEFNYIPKVIAFTGIIITFLWFIPNLRLLFQAHALERFLLLNDRIYFLHIKSVSRQLNTTLLIHNILPSSIIILWIYLFSLTFFVLSVYNFLIKLLPYCLLLILGIRLIIEYSIPKDIEEYIKIIKGESEKK